MLNLRNVPNLIKCRSLLWNILPFSLILIFLNSFLSDLYDLIIVVYDSFNYLALLLQMKLTKLVTPKGDRPPHHLNQNSVDPFAEVQH